MSFYRAPGAYGRYKLNTVATWISNYSLRQRSQSSMLITLGYILKHFILGYLHGEKGIFLNPSPDICKWAYCPLRQGLGILYCIVKFSEADWVGYFQ